MAELIFGAGGVNASAPKTFDITVTGINDKPGISAMNPPTILEGAEEQTIIGWATLLPGVANETDDTAMEYTVSGLNDVFAIAPDVMPNGDLNFHVLLACIMGIFNCGWYIFTWSELELFWSV